MAKKVAVDQFFWNPCFAGNNTGAFFLRISEEYAIRIHLITPFANLSFSELTAMFFSYLGITEGKSIEQIFDKMKA